MQGNVLLDTRPGHRFGGLWLTLALTVALLVATPPPAAESQTVSRLQGGTRVTTAIAVSVANWDTAETALLATAMNYPDALAAAAIAARHDAPLLLTPGSGLPGEVADELVRLDARRVIVMGGTAAVSATVEQQVAALPTNPEVDRISGATRIETAAAAARAAGAPAGEAVLASAANFPDALAAGSLSASPARLPVLLSQRDVVADATMDALHDLDVGHVTLVGGAAVLSGAVVTQLEEAGLSVTRQAGPDRFSTGAAVVHDALSRATPEPRPLIVATGQDFPDALAAGALAARIDGVLLLVPRSALPASLAEFVRDRRDRFSLAIIVGGTAAVGEATQQQLRDALGDQAAPEPPPPPGEGEFGGGTWRVPDEVAPGLYRNTDSSEHCYWERLSGFSGELADIIANGISDDIFIVEIDPGDAGFGSSRCGRWSSDLSPRTSSPTADFGGGHYQVDAEVAPGTWRNSDSSEHCYWERLSGFSGEFADIIANGLSQSIQTVTLAAGDAGFRSRRCGTWTKID